MKEMQKEIMREREKVRQKERKRERKKKRKKAGELVAIRLFVNTEVKVVVRDWQKREQWIPKAVVLKRLCAATAGSVHIIVELSKQTVKKGIHEIRPTHARY